ncbi:MAG: hypothetical protein ACRDND_29480, partial [Streptosporangiaceae bacterium]
MVNACVPRAAFILGGMQAAISADQARCFLVEVTQDRPPARGLAHRLIRGGSERAVADLTLCSLIRACLSREALQLLDPTPPGPRPRPEGVPHVGPLLRP